MKKIVKFWLFVFALVMFCETTIFARGRYYDCDYDYDNPFIYDAYWDYKIAKWSVDGRADKYEVILYRDGYKMTSQITYSSSFDFYSYMSKRGYEYYFEVRPYNYRTGWGTWVSSNWTYVDDHHYREYNYRKNSDRNYVRGDVSYARNQGPPKNVSNNDVQINTSVNTVTQNLVGQTINVPTPQVVYDITFGVIPMGAFTKIDGAWKYLYLNGVYATNTWILSNGKWYYMDVSGNMVTGFYTINGKTYYLNTDGSMVVGNANINGLTHYFDANGVMIY